MANTVTSPMIATTTRSSMRVNPSLLLDGRDVLVPAFAAFGIVAAERPDLVSPPIRLVVEAASEAVLRHLATLDVAFGVEVLAVARVRDEAVQALVRRGVTSAVEPVLVEHGAEVADLHLGRLVLRLVETAHDVGGDQGADQADDRHDDEHLDQGEAVLVPRRRS